MIILAALCSCEGSLFGEKGNGISVRKEIEAQSFDRISIPSFVDVRYTQTTSEHSITLTCDENLAGFYAIEVKDGTLVVDTRNVILNTKADTYVTVCSPVLYEVSLSGSGDLEIDSPVTTDGEFKVRLSGSGDAEFGSIIAQSAEFKTSGSGDIDADAVTAEAISVKTTGSGDCTIGCKDAGTLSVQISGSGDVTLRGTARALINISNTGSGDFNMSGLTLSGK